LSQIGNGQGHEALTRQFQHLRSFPAASRCVTGLLSFAGQLKLLVTTESYELIFLIFASAPKALHSMEAVWQLLAMIELVTLYWLLMAWLGVLEGRGAP
jgi:hypothetical protein